MNTDNLALSIQITPGPWQQPMRYSPEHGVDLPSGSIETNDGKSIAVACASDVSHVEWAANAKALAALPKLLAAAMTAYELLNDPDADENLDAARVERVVSDLAWALGVAGVRYAPGHLTGNLDKDSEEG